MTKVRNGLLAVAIALIMIAVGFFIGSRSVAKKGISHEREDLIEALQGQVSGQANVMRRDEHYIRSLAPQAAHLAGSKIAIFVTDDASADIVDDVIKEVKESRAQITSVAHIHSDAYSDDKVNAVKIVINYSTPEGVKIPRSYIDSGSRLGTILGFITEKPASGLEKARGPIYPQDPNTTTSTTSTTEISAPTTQSTISGSKTGSEKSSANNPGKTTPNSAISQASSSSSTAPTTNSQHTSTGQNTSSSEKTTEKTSEKTTVSSASMSSASSVSDTTAHPITSAKDSSPTSGQPLAPAQEHSPIFHTLTSRQVVPTEGLTKSYVRLVHSKRVSLVTFDAKPLLGAADYALFIIGKSSEDPGKSAIIAGIANGLAYRGAGTVVVAPDSDEGSVVSAIRNNQVYADRINTVDNAGTVLGKAAAILAIHGGRQIGHYGTGKLATDVLLLK